MKGAFALCVRLFWRLTQKNNEKIGKIERENSF
jgi:hypothetical protein